MVLFYFFITIWISLTWTIRPCYRGGQTLFTEKCSFVKKKFSCFESFVRGQKQSRLGPSWVWVNSDWSPTWSSFNIFLRVPFLDTCFSLRNFAILLSLVRNCFPRHFCWLACFPDCRIPVPTHARLPFLQDVDGGLRCPQKAWPDVLLALCVKTTEVQLLWACYRLWLSLLFFLHFFWCLKKTSFSPLCSPCFCSEPRQWGVPD